MSAEAEFLLMMAGAFGVVLGLPTLILIPLLWARRLLLHVEVIGADGRPAAGVVVRGLYNRAGAALGPTAEGALVSRALHAEAATLGRTDARGRLLRTLFLRQVHTVLVGDQTHFVDSVRERMTATQPFVIRLTGTPADHSMQALFEGRTR